jgi:hypothetical protein
MAKPLQQLERGNADFGEEGIDEAGMKSPIRVSQPSIQFMIVGQR